MEVAQARSVPPAQISLAWMFRKPHITAPIIGATKASHLDDAVAALEVSLTEEEVRRLEEPYRPHEIKGHG